VNCFGAYLTCLDDYVGDLDGSKLVHPLRTDSPVTLDFCLIVVDFLELLENWFREGKSAHVTLKAYIPPILPERPPSSVIWGGGFFGLRLNCD